MQQKKFTGKVYLKKGQTIHVKIKRLGINGEGIGYYKKKDDIKKSSFLKAIEHCGKSVRNSLGTNLGLNRSIHEAFYSS